MPQKVVPLVRKDVPQQHNKGSAGKKISAKTFEKSISNVGKKDQQTVQQEKKDGKSDASSKVSSQRQHKLKPAAKDPLSFDDEVMTVDNDTIDTQAIDGEPSSDDHQQTDDQGEDTEEQSDKEEAMNDDTSNVSEIMKSKFDRPMMEADKRSAKKRSTYRDSDDSSVTKKGKKIEPVVHNLPDNADEEDSSDESDEEGSKKKRSESGFDASLKNFYYNMDDQERIDAILKGKKRSKDDPVIQFQNLRVNDTTSIRVAQAHFLRDQNVTTIPYVFICTCNAYGTFNVKIPLRQFAFFTKQAFQILNANKAYYQVESNNTPVNIMSSLGIEF